jgi:hypothetical protein
MGNKNTHGFSSPLSAEKTGPESEAPLTDANKQSGSSPTPDFSIEGEGRFCSVYLLRPLTPAAFDWIEEHIPEDAQRLGNAVAIEHRYIGAIASQILAEGLRIV